MLSEAPKVSRSVGYIVILMHVSGGQETQRKGNKTSGTHLRVHLDRKTPLSHTQCHAEGMIILNVV